MSIQFPPQCPPIIEPAFLPYMDKFGVEVFDMPSLVNEMLPPMISAVEGLIPEGCTLLTGRPRIGKSTLALQLAIAVASGEKALGHLPVEQSEVLYLALEDDVRSLQARAKRLLGGREAPAGLKFALDWCRIDEGGDDDLENWLRQNPAVRFVVIDTFQKIRSHNQRRSDFYSLALLTDMARKFGISLLVIQHTRKANPDSEFDIFTGRSLTRCLADGMLVMHQTRSGTEATLRIAGKQVGGSTQALKMEKETMSWEMLGEAAEAWHKQDGKEIAGLFEQIERPLSARETADCLDRPVSSVRKTLMRMLRADQIQSVGSGRFATKAHDAEICEHNRPDRKAAMATGP